MLRFWGTGLGALLIAVALAPVSGAKVQVPSGDTCSATGSNNTYTLVINIPSTASEQGGFAFGATGTTVVSAKAPGNPGTFSTNGLPANTTGAWLLTTSSAPPGSSVSATLKTSGPVKAFRVVPGSSTSNGAPMTFFDTIVCGVSKVVMPSNAFSVNPHATYVSSLRAWHLTVSIGSAGTVRANQLEPTVGTMASQQKTAKSLVQTRRKSLNSAGKVTLTLTPTATGLAMLRTHASLHVKLSVSFNVKSGKSAPAQIISLTLRK